MRDNSVDRVQAGYRTHSRLTSLTQWHQPSPSCNEQIRQCHVTATDERDWSMSASQWTAHRAQGAFRGSSARAAKFNQKGAGRTGGSGGQVIPRKFTWWSNMAFWPRRFFGKKYFLVHRLVDSQQNYRIYKMPCYRILQQHCAVSLSQHGSLVGLCLQTAVNYLSKCDNSYN